MLENINKSFYSKDLSHKEHNCSTDKLAALAMSYSLGAAVIRSNATGQHLKDLILKLSNKIKHKEQREEVRIKIASLALVEYMNQLCNKCNGNGSGRTERGLVISCVTCSGSGKHRYTDKQRSELTQLTWTDNLSKLLNITHSYLSAAQSASLNDIKQKLKD